MIEMFALIALVACLITLMLQFVRVLCEHTFATPANLPAAQGLDASDLLDIEDEAST